MSNLVEIKVPDIGDFKDVEIIEILVKAGDSVKNDASVLVLESDKATMEIPSPSAGTVRELKVKVGDKVSQGTLFMMLETAAAEQQAKAVAQVAIERAAAPDKPASAPSPTFDPSRTIIVAPPPPVVASATSSEGNPHASPSVRKFARELGVNLNAITGTADKGRITKEDVQGFVKQTITSGGAPTNRGAASSVNFAPNLPDLPNVDFSKFGAIESKALSRIKKISGPVLHRNWLAIPHITQFDEADMTELEAFRKAQGADAEKQGVKLTPLAFMIKAAVAALKKFPLVNASIDGNDIIYHGYYDVGIAVGSSRGLVVPIIRDADKLTFADIEKTIADFGTRAQDGKLTIEELTGGTFSISNGGVFGSMLSTPIINPPQSAILGVHATKERPVVENGQIVIRPMNYLALSYDHRIIDGREAVLSLVAMKDALEDPARLLLEL